MKRVLIIEDEMEIAKVLAIELEYEGYEVIIEYDGKSGLETALRDDIHLILLDVMLPVFSGMEVLRRFRKAGKSTPVILLTARNATTDKVVGLDQGANDYVTKPFEIEELLARIRSCIRTSTSMEDTLQPNNQASLLCVKDLVINTETRDVRRDEEEIILTPKEYDLLVYLLTHKNKIVTREGILTNVWGYEFEGETNVIDVYIRHLRKKLENTSASSLIQTVRGVGYMVREK